MTRGLLLRWTGRGSRSFPRRVAARCAPLPDLSDCKWQLEVGWYGWGSQESSTTHLLGHERFLDAVGPSSIVSCCCCELNLTRATPRRASRRWAVRHCYADIEASSRSCRRVVHYGWPSWRWVRMLRPLAGCGAARSTSWRTGRQPVDYGSIDGPSCCTENQYGIQPPGCPGLGGFTFRSPGAPGWIVFTLDALCHVYSWHPSPGQACPLAVGWNWPGRREHPLPSQLLLVDWVWVYSS